MLLDRVCFSYGDKEVFRDFTLELPDGGVTAILGDSGVGKTTLLHLLSGLVKADSGQVPTGRTGYMFQQPRLLPTLTVLKNVQVALPPDRVDSAVQWLRAVELGDALTLYPHQLSGGMAQRVSMARAFAYGGDMLLMDEPFRGLDLALQARLQDVFVRLRRQSNITTVLVTHDVDEAVTLGQRVVVLREKPCRVVYQSDVTPDNADEVRAHIREALLQTMQD